jgi:choline dehydrogenase-like flavoprotein
MSEDDFKATSIDGYGIDWPLTYQELAPYYERIEMFLGLWGTKEGLSQLPDGFYSKKLALNHMEERFKAAVEAEWPEIRVIPPRIVQPEMETTPKPLKAALETGRLTLRPNAMVTAVLMERNGRRARGVEFIDRLTRQRHEALANIVVLCASTIESVRILLNSAGSNHPGGLGNASNKLGRGLMDHCISLLFGRVSDSLQNYDQSNAIGFYIPKFQKFPERENQHLRGYAIQGAIDRNGPMWYLMAIGEMLPHTTNRITLDPSKKDAWGIPVVRLECRPSENEIQMVAHQRAMLMKMMCIGDLESGRFGCGAFKWWLFQQLAPWSWRRPASIPGVAIHETGGARMGSNPEESVVNRYNQCWDAQNVYITDGACFPSSGCQNITLTIMALTARACAHILE